MSDAIRPQPGILDIALYEGGKAKLAGRDEVLKLSSNENPLGPGPAAQAALKRLVLGNAGADLHRYPSTDHAELRETIARVHGLDAARVICGVGSDEVIAFLCQAYAGPGDEVLFSQYGFLMYRISAQAAGATPVAAPERDRHTDVDALLAAATERTRLVFVANPNNPTGTMIDPSEIERLADGLPDHALLVLDGAYAEYVEGFDGGLALVEGRSNVVMTRTLSKIHGLGGLRVGWGYGPKAVIDVLNRVRGPFNLSSLQQAIATAALEDHDHVARSRRENAAARDWLTGALRAAGVGVDDSLGNFILARFDTPARAAQVDAALQAGGILVRRMDGYALPEALRITIGTMEDCRRLAGLVVQTLEAD
ncbi:histidinol-phosphate transaminase [Pararhodobacter sp. SW119]|uniref:histidinol-phosphate transaminase n=1 Tax=Pararhodobacter sp. SW119 TaxID=2780075 RepID=UPI001AE0BB68|nr:histidinol-phosphate transaminase [Pararhodobacter sp. SW119]